VVKVCVEPDEEMARVFQSFEVLETEKVWETPLSPLREVMPEPAAPEPRHAPEIV
jgi:hypothetical protein